MAWSVMVNADDYGLTEGTARAILRAHRDGVVTATSVLTVAPAFATTARWLGDAPDLAPGLHLAAVGEDPPLLSAREVPTLVDRRGRFALSSVRLTPRLALGRIDPADLEREFQAQHDAFVDAVGRRPSHVDSHHNLHLWPSVAAVVARLSPRWGVPVVRLPWSRRRAPVGVGVRHLARGLARRLDGAGLAHPDRYFGIDEGGQLDTPALLGLVRHLDRGAPPRPGAVVEIAVHPGEPGDADLDRYPWPGARRDAELAGLTAPALRAALDRGRHTLVGPEALPGAGPRASAVPAPAPPAGPPPGD
ncbi:MAG: ChbG/HpnK family deacetylase [Acidimicrobiales bacterium]|nr:ChbG/HpnK family deacetylase [Acidimicrobiales bacterium]